MEYSLDFSQRLIDAAKSFVGKGKDSTDDETARAVLYLSLLSCEISLKALLEQAGFTPKELKKRSHDFSGLVKDLCFCDLIGTGIGGSKPYSAARLLSQVVDSTIANGTVGALLRAEEHGASKYPNEIRYGELVQHYPHLLMLGCASTICQWARENVSIIRKRVTLQGGSTSQGTRGNP